MAVRKEIMKKISESSDYKAAVTPELTKPTYLQKFEGKPIHDGSNFDNTDVTIPRVKLIQAMSDEPKTFNQAKPGEFWHTGMDLPLGTELDFVVVSRRKKYLLAAPLEDGQGILARSEDFIHWQPPQGSFQVKIKGRKTPMTWKVAPTVAESGLDKWGTYNDEDDSSPPAATLFYDYLVILPKYVDLGLVVLSLTRSQIKKAKKGLNDKIAMHEGAGRPMQSLVFRAKVVSEDSPQGSYYNYQFTSNGFSSEQIFNSAWQMKDALRTFQVRDEEKVIHEQDTPTEESKDY